MLSLAWPLSCLRDRALEEGLKGGRCHPSVPDYHITAVLGLAGSGWAAKLLERSGSGGAFEGGKDCAESGWAAKLLERSGSGGGFEGGRCHPSVSDYHITAVLGLAGSGWAAKLLERSGAGGVFEGGKDCAEFGWAAKLLERSGPGGGFEGGKVPSVSFGLPYNCCAGSGWAAKLLERSGAGGVFEGGKDCAEFGWAAKLLERSGPGGGFEGGKVPSVSFGLPYNCCAGSGWAPA